MAITPDQAQQLLLGNGLRLVDSAASNVPGANATAIAYISQNANGLFKKDSNYNNPFVNNATGSHTPEQNSLTFNPSSNINFTVQIGANAGLHALGLGNNIEGGVTFGLGKNVNICSYTRSCETIGPGLAAGVGVGVTVGAGSASSGASKSSGAFIQGGDGWYGDTTVTHDNSGNISVGKGVLGVGAGAAAGQAQCTQTSHCVIN
ncbi:hypothetical protein [Paraburkholderia sp. CNPSo 3281]|uniref:hypothetical protein n=1 Tax=Paraburkholderia sp. CNPSo 3281 TaxID=2940933 RepID=UPI0020B78214|nr:hypothetical protein [Paraburkholderia sp. CNPSo 3281]MCP3715801.1 hypothetical protein [Paraburkholderia sp. CNPSo 3281]